MSPFCGQSGGQASGVTVTDGSIKVDSGATVSGTVLAGPGAAMTVSGVAIGTIVSFAQPFE